MSTTSTAQTLEVPGYQVLQYLGSGARSTIWQIRDRRTSQVFALKRVVKHHAGDVRFLEQAVNEYEVASKLSHPAIRKIPTIRRLKHWLSVREVHLVMEYCEGKTIQESVPDSHGEVIRVFHVVADALAHMNARGFVHADIKPNNILVGPDGSVKIIDLGQSCLIGTVKQRIQGTPDFIAPEQVYRRPLDARTDVYNFGASLYWTLMGKPIPTVLPKRNADTPSSATAISDMRIVPPAEENPAISTPLSKLIMDCVQTRQSLRPASMSEVANRLELIGHAMSNPAGAAPIELELEEPDHSSDDTDIMTAIDADDIDKL